MRKLLSEDEDFSMFTLRVVKGDGVGWAFVCFAHWRIPCCRKIPGYSHVNLTWEFLWAHVFFTFFNYVIYIKLFPPCIDEFTDYKYFPDVSVTLVLLDRHWGMTIEFTCVACLLLALGGGCSDIGRKLLKPLPAMLCLCRYPSLSCLSEDWEAVCVSQKCV